MYEVMLGRSTIAWTSARTSGSETGYGPAPSCSPSGAPAAGHVPVEGETFECRRDRDRYPVPVADRSLGQDAEELAVHVVGATGDEEPRIVGGGAGAARERPRGPGRRGDGRRGAADRRGAPSRSRSSPACA